VILACVEARRRDYRALDELYGWLPARRSGSTTGRRVTNLILLAELLSEIGDVERGLAALDAISPDHRDAILAPEIRRVRGELLLRRNERDQGERQLREAIEMARRRSERILELRATTSLARLWQQKGRRGEACQMLVEIYGWFTEGFDTADLREAKALLDELSDPSDRGGAPARQ